MARAIWILIWRSLSLLSAEVPHPADWVPMRWPYSDIESLDLLDGGPVNCLLVKNVESRFAAAAAQRGVATLAVIAPGEDSVTALRNAAQAKAAGAVLVGDSSSEPTAAIPVIPLTSRRRLRLTAPVAGTYEGVWPGVEILESGAMKAGPTGSAWIDTNTGFLRMVRGGYRGVLWIANRPPPKAIITNERYLQVIADAASVGARWVVELDDDFAARLHRRQPQVLDGWRRMLQMLRYFEQHPEWRRMRQYGRIAVVQDPAQGGLLSGGILDMLAAGHRPALALTRRTWNGEDLRDMDLVVNLDPAAAQAISLRGAAALVNAPPIWSPEAGDAGRFTLNKAEFDLLDKLSARIDELAPPRNSPIRIFNAPSMLSHAMLSGESLVVHLVNYSEYPAENISVRFPGAYRTAILTGPDLQNKSLEIAREDAQTSVTIDKMRVLATLTLTR